MAGRPRKPTAISRLDGNPGKRPLNGSEPAPNVGIGKPSAHLDKTARKVFRELSAKLIGIGLLTEVDQAIFELHCQAQSDVARLTEEIRSEGEVLTENGGAKMNPKCRLLRAAQEVLRQTARDMGLTPEVRSKLHVSMPTKAPGSDVLSFIDAITGDVG